MHKKEIFPKIYLDHYDDTLEPYEGKRIVFLDIGGVICDNCDEKYSHDLKRTAQYLAWKYHDDIYTKMYAVDVGLAYYDWNSLAIGRLKQFLFDQDAEVVVHSDWCLNTTLEELKALFRLHAMDEYIYDKYDIVVCSQVLEHIPFELFEATIKRICKITKNLLLSLPNKNIRVKFWFYAPILGDIIKKIHFRMFWKNQRDVNKE